MTIHSRIAFGVGIAQVDKPITVTVDSNAINQRHTAAAKGTPLRLFHLPTPCNCSNTANSSVMALTTAKNPGLDRSCSKAIAQSRKG